MKTLLCGIAKLENDYIREWVEHHLNLGFDKIILGDNNDPDGEWLADPIMDYVQSEKVQVFNIRNNNIKQMGFYNDLYLGGYCNEYDWVIFLDIDEFLFLEEDKTVGEYLSRDIFKDFTCIKIHWRMMDDNDQLINTGEPVVKRFTRAARPIPMIWHNPTNGFTKTLEMNMFVKSFVKPGLKNVAWDNAPQPVPMLQEKGKPIELDFTKFEHGLVVCNNNGEKLEEKYTDETTVDDIDYTLAHIKHYRTKTIEEYISKKCSRSWPIEGCDDKNWAEKYLNLNFFFDINHRSPEKLILAEDLKEKYNLNL